MSWDTSWENLFLTKRNLTPNTELRWKRKFASTLLLCIHVSFDTATSNLLKHSKEVGLPVQKKDSKFSLDAEEKDKFSLDAEEIVNDVQHYSSRN